LRPRNVSNLGPRRKEPLGGKSSLFPPPLFGIEERLFTVYSGGFVPFFSPLELFRGHARFCFSGLPFFPSLPPFRRRGRLSKQASAEGGASPLPLSFLKKNFARRRRVFPELLREGCDRRKRRRLEAPDRRRCFSLFPPSSPKITLTFLYLWVVKGGHPAHRHYKL